MKVLHRCDPLSRRSALALNKAAACPLSHPHNQIQLKVFRIDLQILN